MATHLCHMADFVHVPTAVTASRLLGLRFKEDDAESAVVQLRKHVRAGFSADRVERVAKQANLPVKDVLALIDLSQRTYERRQSDGKHLTLSQSDRLLRLARIFAKATHVLGSAEKASRFMQKSNRALCGESPFAHIDSELGEDAVLEILGRIEHGIIG